MAASADARALLSRMPSCDYLCDSGTTVDGVSVWGSPWQPAFHDWAFNLPRGDACRAKWQLIPADTDVLITHGPPLGHGDLCLGGHRAGCLGEKAVVPTPSPTPTPRPCARHLSASLRSDSRRFTGRAAVTRAASISRVWTRARRLRRDHGRRDHLCQRVHVQPAVPTEQRSTVLRRACPGGTGQGACSRA